MLSCFNNIKAGDKVRIGILNRSFIKREHSKIKDVEFFDCEVLRVKQFLYAEGRGGAELVLWYHMQIPFFNISKMMGGIGFDTPFVGNDYIHKIIKKC